ncbi:MAG TPA: Ig-like domain-containing protein [Candidatus Acidoferrales bacterium]|nr:Ig-like domain-containing protein [Candidatus Acidoferrales bacterium]
MLNRAGTRAQMCWLGCLTAVICLAATAVQADTMVNVTSVAGQAANDTVNWSQLGADQTVLGASFGATSGGGVGITVSLAGANSIVSVDCVATPCSWEGGPALTAGDSLIWTSDNGNSGNGPITFTFSKSLSGAGAFVQANAPGQFTVQIQAFNGTTLLGTFSETSDASGDAMYIGLMDSTGPNITKVTFSLTACGPEDSSGCTDFAVDTLNLNTTTSSKQSTTTAVISSVNPSSFNQLVTFTATVTPATSGTPTGSVTFKNGTTTLGTGTLTGGVATFSTSTLAIGSHSITGVYGGDTNYTGSTSPILTQTVNKTATNTSAIISSLNPSTYGQSVTLTVTVSSTTTGTPTGSVTFKDGTVTLGTKTLVAGVAAFSTTKISAGTRSITAVYGGSSTFLGSTSPILTQTVNKVGTTTSAIASSLNPSTYGVSVTFTVTVTSTTGAIPTGSVTFKDGTTTLGSKALVAGVAAFATTKVAAGTRSITAIYAGTSNFIGSTSPAFTQTVNKAGTTTTVVSSLNPSTFGTSVTFTATVAPATSGTPSGSVTFKDGATTLATKTLSSGKATFATTTLAKGSHSITVVYGGNANFTGSTSSVLTQTVN